MQANCKSASLSNFGSSGDALKKREEFAISLRKKKKQELLAMKRLKLQINQPPVVKTSHYQICDYFVDMIVRDSAPIHECPQLQFAVVPLPLSDTSLQHLLQKAFPQILANHISNCSLTDKVKTCVGYNST